MNTTTIKPANLTRHTRDLPAKFLRERRLHLIPLYHLLRTSDLAREGIERSGSYRFADHLYANRASGRGWFGRWLDRRLLNLRASCAMRDRCLRSSAEMRRAFDAHLVTGTAEPFRILTVPCGIPRDVRDFAAQLAAENPALLARVEYIGFDLDSEVITAAEAFLREGPLPTFTVQRGDALHLDDYPAQPPHFIASTGLGEFLDDEALAVFYRNVFHHLASGGAFFTSALDRERGADYLLRAFELETRYRDRAELEGLLAACPWRTLEIEEHPSGLQTYARAIKQ